MSEATAKICISCDARVEIDADPAKVPRAGPCSCGAQAWRADFTPRLVDGEAEPEPPPSPPSASTRVLPRPLSLRDFDFDDPDVQAFLASTRDPEFEKNQPECCCAIERDENGAVKAHQPSLDCPIHEHQHEDSSNHRDRIGA